MKKSYKIFLVIFTIVFVFAAVFSLSACVEKPWLMEKSTMFYLDMTLESKIMGIPFLFAIDTDKSGVLLRRDGTVRVTLITNSLVSTLISLLPDLSSLQIDDATRTLIDTLAADYFPGFSLDDPINSLELVEKGVNLKLVGLDDPDFRQALIHFGETGALPQNFSIPKGFGIEFNSKYYLSKVQAQDGTEYIAVNIGKHSKGGEGPILLTLLENEEGIKEVTFRFGVLDLYLRAVERV